MPTDSEKQLDQIRADLRKLKTKMVTWLNSDDWGRDCFDTEFEDNFGDAISLVRKAAKLIN